MVPERKKSINKEVSLLLVMEQNKTMARVLVESKAWVILFFIFPANFWKEWVLS